MYSAREQLHYLWIDIKAATRRQPSRWFSIWFSQAFLIVLNYRLSRTLLLIFGRRWAVLRVVLSPLTFLLRPWLGSSEIHYRADIGPGLRILHPTLGVVVSGHAVIGKNLVLTGGNCIGGRLRALRRGELVIGDNVTLGANSNIIGPAIIGNRVIVGVGAVVLHDAPDDAVLVGIPAHQIKRTSGAPS